MDSIWQIFLRAKHWQIFFLILGTYLLSVAATSRLSPRLRPGIGQNAVGLILLIAAGIVPYVFSLFGWLWAAGLLFNANLEPDLRLRTGFFRFAIVYAVFGLVFGLPILWASDEIQERWLLLPQFFGFICIIYILSFMAKAFVTLKRGQPSRLWHYSGAILQFLILPVSVWHLQPRINLLYATAQKRVV